MSTAIGTLLLPRSERSTPRTSPRSATRSGSACRETSCSTPRRPPRCSGSRVDACTSWPALVGSAQSASASARSGSDGRTSTASWRVGEQFRRVARALPRGLQTALQSQKIGALRVGNPTVSRYNVGVQQAARRGQPTPGLTDDLHRRSPMYRVPRAPARGRLAPLAGPGRVAARSSAAATQPPRPPGAPALALVLAGPRPACAARGQPVTIPESAYAYYICERQLCRAPAGFVSQVPRSFVNREARVLG